MKLRLAYVMDTLPKYENTFKNGPYKNGNYKGITILVDKNNTRHSYDANEFPKELLEKPYYVKGLYPTVLSAYGGRSNPGLSILLDKEDNYER